jgi:tetratricopeptide (TPR) repeat protein
MLAIRFGSLYPGLGALLMKTRIFCALVGILIFLWAGSALAQSESQAINLAKEAKIILNGAKSKEDYQRAAKKYEEALKISEKVKSDKWTDVCSFQLGWIQSRLGEYHKSLEHYEKSLEICKKLGDAKGEGLGLNNIGLLYDNLGQYSKALDYYEKSLAINKKIGNVSLEGTNLGNIGAVYDNLGQYSKALDYYEKSLAIRKKLGDVSGEGYNLNNIGLVYQSLGQYSKALDYYEQSLAIRKKLGDVSGEGYNLNNIGLVYKSFGQYTKALDYYERSLSISRKIGNTSLEGTNLGNIGGVYDSLGQYSKALDYYEQSLAIRKKIGDVSGEGLGLNNIGLVYDNLGQYSKALDYYKQSLAICKKIGNVSLEGTNLGNIGAVYDNLGQYSKALDHYEQSLAIRKKIGDVSGEGYNLNNIGLVYYNLGQYSKALDHYEQSLAINKKIGNVSLEGTNLNNIGLVYKSLGQYWKALDYYEQSLAISKKIGNASLEGTNLGNIGGVYDGLGEYAKALDYYEQSLIIRKKIGDVNGEGTNLNNIGSLYKSLGQYAKALDYYEQSLIIRKKIGDVNGEATNLGNMAFIYAAMGRFEEAERRLKESMQIKQELGVPLESSKDLLANLYLDAGAIANAEPLINETKYDSTLGRLALLKFDYPSAKKHYENDMKWAEKTGNTTALFRSYTGLGRAYEGAEDYTKSEEYYEKAMKLAEEIRSGLLPSERRNFFEVKVEGFARSDPARGLTRVKMKLNRGEGSIDSSEITRARTFSEHLSETSSTGSSGVPKETLEKEQSLVNKLAALKKELSKTDKEKQSSKYENLTKDVQDAQTDLAAFIETLWKQNPDYAAVKYPRPVTLKESALSPEECAVIFDVSGEGVGVKLVRNKTISETFFKKWDQKDLENDIKKFREPFEKLRFKEFDPELAESLYKKLLLRVLVDVSKGTPLIIIPDGILALLPFEALVTGGKVHWNKGEYRVDNPDGLTFLGDEHPISYYQSITALTLARIMGNKDSPKDKLLVLADPVFAMKDQRAQQASSTKLAERDKQNNLQLMQTIEDTSDGSFSFKRLPETGILADNLGKMYGSHCLSLTGLRANKADFLFKIAPTIDQYGSVVFATHGVMSTRIPGLMEPFLALSMAPPGTDGFLKMSDILSLKMNADVVALTACQSGLGKELSGEGVMSMGRAFQYAGAKSVLMSLWEVEEKSAMMLAENFFRYRKQGKTKLESLKLARNDIRNAGYKHPFFWSAFILVGETN